MINYTYALPPAGGQPGAHSASRALLRLLTLSLLTLLLPLLALAQNREISGKVTDATGSGLPGVSVVVPGTSVGASTDPDGNFRLQVPSSATQLTASFVGYTKQTRP